MNAKGRSSRHSGSDRRRTGSTQREINKAEWQNPDNWGGPRWLSVYFSKKDSRTVVPKQIPWMGWTLNLAKTTGVLMFLGILVILCLLPLLSLVFVLNSG